jgi:hypothetical protein
MEERDVANLTECTDDKTTFQQKIDFANARGLNGLLIWAIDQDDDSFTALKAVTGKDLAPTVAESDTLGQWSSNSCWVTPCGTGCQEGWVTMVCLSRVCQLGINKYRLD